MCRKSLSLGALLLAFLLQARAQQVHSPSIELLAGTARVDITPPKGHAMGGYGARKGGVTGIHDPLSARVLVLKSGDESVAFVTCDLRSFVADRIRGRVRQKTGIRHLLVSNSHTHSGPLTWELRSPWYSQTEDKIVNAVAEAASRLQPVSVGFGRSAIYLGHNRRKIGADGRAVMFWRNAKEEPTSPVDPTVTVLRVDARSSGKTLAVIVHYACHAVVLGPDNREVSGDYPAAMASEVEKTLGDGALCMFWQGAAGDINVYKDKQRVDEGGFAEVDRVGKALAGVVLEASQRIRMRGSLELRAKSTVIRLGHRWEPQKTIEAGITAVTLGEELALVTLPGEAFVDFQIRLRDQSEVPHTLLVGYTSGAGDEWIGYLPTIEAAVSGGYGASYNTTVEVGAGNRLVDSGLLMIYELLGRVRDAPQR